MNGLAIAADNPADVGLPELHFKDRHFPTRNLGEDHVIGKFDQLTDDELEELFHCEKELNTNYTNQH